MVFMHLSWLCPDSRADGAVLQVVERMWMLHTWMYTCLERRNGEVGSISAPQLQLLIRVIITLFVDVHQVAPTSRYLVCNYNLIC